MMTCLSGKQSFLAWSPNTLKKCQISRWAFRCVWGLKLKPASPWHPCMQTQSATLTQFDITMHNLCFLENTHTQTHTGVISSSRNCWGVTSMAWCLLSDGPLISAQHAVLGTWTTHTHTIVQPQITSSYFVRWWIPTYNKTRQHFTFFPFFTSNIRLLFFWCFFFKLVT